MSMDEEKTNGIVSLDDDALDNVTGGIGFTANVADTFRDVQKQAEKAMNDYIDDLTSQISSSLK